MTEQRKAERSERYRTLSEARAFCEALEQVEKEKICSIYKGHREYVVELFPRLAGE